MKSDKVQQGLSGPLMVLSTHRSSLQTPEVRGFYGPQGNFGNFSGPVDQVLLSSLADAVEAQLSSLNKVHL